MLVLLAGALITNKVQLHFKRYLSSDVYAVVLHGVNGGVPHWRRRHATTLGFDGRRVIYLFDHGDKEN